MEKIIVKCAILWEWGGGGWESLRESVREYLIDIGCLWVKYHRDSMYIWNYVAYSSYQVFEIKGAPCTLCAHFGCRVHTF